MDEKNIALRVEELLSQMTLEEKAAQMVQIPYSHVGREKALEWARKGVGSFLHVLGDDAREVQQTVIHESRLGIPVIFGIDAIHGHGLNDHATIFPTQLAAACSWNPEIVREMGRITAREVATDGLHWTFSPVLCLGRDTRWGRVNETFGEDPYLAGEMGAAIIEGYQGESLDAADSILACAKHYIGYGEAVGARDSADTEMTYRKMKEVFLPPFKRAVEAGCATIMTAYGSIDGTPFTTDAKSLKDILRGELGFDGFVVTDWNNVGNLVGTQKVAENIADAAVMAANAGNDLMMTTAEFYEAAISAVRAGKLDEAVLDEAVRHILTIKFRMNLFEKPEKLGDPGCIGSEKHHAAALRAARASVTLLKNKDALPLKNAVKVAVIGRNADDIRAQYGDWTYFTHPGPKPNHPQQRPFVTVREGLEALCNKYGAACVYHPGCEMVGDTNAAEDIAAAVETAKGADAIVLVVGDVISQIGESHDRANLALSGQQLAQYQALRALNIPITVVLVASKPLCIPEIAASADAVICDFNGGMFGGQAVAEAIWGELNPAGRLPISFPQHSGQVPVYYNQLVGWHAKRYCDLPVEPVYAFGEGLGYAPFTYANLAVDAEALTVAVDVTNAGEVDGTETVQVYLNDAVASVMRPVKQLIAFARVELAPGETKRVEVQLKRDDFALVNRAEERVVEPGLFTIFAGHSSKDADLLKTTLTLA